MLKSAYLNAGRQPRPPGQQSSPFGPCHLDVKRNETSTFRDLDGLHIAFVTGEGNNRDFYRNEDLPRWLWTRYQGKKISLRIWRTTRSTFFDHPWIHHNGDSSHRPSNTCLRRIWPFSRRETFFVPGIWLFIKGMT